jgi:hypothetical protein
MLIDSCRFWEDEMLSAVVTGCTGEIGNAFFQLLLAKRRDPMRCTAKNS